MDLLGIRVMMMVCLVAMVGWRVAGYPKEDLVESLPSQPKVKFRQYAGYVDVVDNTSLFYYFVEADGDADKKPLTLWLNGGPGCSSIGGGAFIELGPFHPSSDSPGLHLNKYSWNQVSNLLFVESPAGVGWSYSAGTQAKSGDNKTANEMYSFMTKWYEKFPEFKSRDLFLTGESYAGHYIPHLADVLLNHNKASSNSFKFPIKGVAIGNPFLRLSTDMATTYLYYWSHGVISDELFHFIALKCNFEHYARQMMFNQSMDCNLGMSLVKQLMTNVDHYDMLVDTCLSEINLQEYKLKNHMNISKSEPDICIKDAVTKYLNQPEVQRALHANRNVSSEWAPCTPITYDDEDVKADMLPYLKRILESNIPLWLYSGDQDTTVPFLSTRILVRELAEKLKFEITADYSGWLDDGNKTAGWTIGYGNLLNFVIVRSAGHMVPLNQPQRALILFTKFINGQKLAEATDKPQKPE